MSEEGPIVIDAIGQQCPMPVILTKRSMRGAPAHREIHVLVDDPEALHDIPALLQRHGWPAPTIEPLDRGWRMVLTQQQEGEQPNSA